MSLEDAGWDGTGPFYGGKVHVCREMCSTCVFRPGNLMELRSGRVRSMVDEALENDSAITCHSTLPHEQRAVCRGFFDRYSTLPLRLAHVMERLEFVDPLSWKEAK